MNNLVPYRNGRRVGPLLSWEPMRLFDQLTTWQPPGSEVVWSAFRSPVNVTQTDDGAIITVDMPGVDTQDVELMFENGALLIAGKRGDHVYRYDVALGDTIDPGAIEAQLDKGVLSVHARKRAEAKPRKIPVTTVGKPPNSNESK